MTTSQLSDIDELRRQITVARSEIKNIRLSVLALRKKQEKEVADIKAMLTTPLPAPESLPTARERAEMVKATDHTQDPPLRPIAYMESVFKTKNGTPRQSGICPEARGRFTILKSALMNPQYSLEGLDQFSHIWILFLFHDNTSTDFTHAKVQPPRMDGAKTGLFSSRSPYRPNPIGLTLAKLERIQGCTVQVSGIDIIDGTPILDIKPYIPQYDQPIRSLDRMSIKSDWPIKSDEHSSQPIRSAHDLSARTNEPIKSDSVDQELQEPELESADVKQESADFESSEATSSRIRTAHWVEKPHSFKVAFTSRAMEDLSRFTVESDSCKLELFNSNSELKQAIESILQADPRSVYRKTRCRDKLYYFRVDCADVTAWFDGNLAEVLRVRPPTSEKDMENK